MHVVLSATIVFFILGTCSACHRPEERPSSEASETVGEHQVAGPSSDCPTTSAEFWSWFRESASDLARRDFEHDVRYLNRLGRAVRCVSPDLAFEIGGRPGELRELVTSAEGLRSQIPTVQQLVGAAPEIPGWRVTAFRQRQAHGMDVSFQGVNLRPQDVRFSTEADGAKIGIHLYLPPVSRSKADAQAMASLLLLDTVLEEYDVMTQIGFIERHSMPEDLTTASLRPILELAVVVDAHKARAGRDIGSPDENQTPPDDKDSH